jgi:hypothetical protein
VNVPGSAAGQPAGLHPLLSPVRPALRSGHVAVRDRVVVLVRGAREGRKPRSLLAVVDHERGAGHVVVCGGLGKELSVQPQCGLWSWLAGGLTCLTSAPGWSGSGLRSYRYDRVHSGSAGS